ncbi:unnamed protein product [Caenorhabditis nigoni]
MKPNLTRKATQKEIDSLSNFIGGLEKWPILDGDCRKEIIKYLDYKSRFQLSICSKLDFEIVNSVPMHIHKIEIKDNERYQCLFSQEEFENVLVNVQFNDDYNSGNHLELVFSQSGEDTVVQWMKRQPRKKPEAMKVIWKSCNYYKKAVEYAEDWMKKVRFELKELSVGMSKYPFECSLIKSLPHCKEISIGSDSLDDFHILALPQIMNSPKIYIGGKAGFTDDQLICLKAKVMNFDCINITDEGINRFLKNWINGKGIDDFRQLLLWSTQMRDPSIVIRGIQIRPWDEEFRQEARGFCDDFDRCCGRG